MRKKVLSETRDDSRPAGSTWLDLEEIAQVEVTSEDAAHPIEAALTLHHPAGWRAAQSGRQTIRVLFDEPQALRRLHLLFTETQRERHQEFVLRWSAGPGQPKREIVRQQYYLSPHGSARELEDYKVELEGVRSIELTITPDTSDDEACASLDHWHMA